MHYKSLETTDDNTIQCIHTQRHANVVTYMYNVCTNTPKVFLNRQLHIPCLIHFFFKCIYICANFSKGRYLSQQQFKTFFFI
jgi:hypothetical protein